MKRFAAALGVAACVASGVSAPRATTRASAPCPSLSEATRLKTVEPTLRGDVDGDGRLDSVSVVYEPRAPESCGILLLARTKRGPHAERLRGSLAGPAENSIRAGLPRLFGVLQLGDDTSRQIVVHVWSGAHATMYAVYRLWHGRLRRVGVQGQSLAPFTWDAGLTTHGSVDCVDTGTTVMVVEYFAEQRYPKPGWDLDMSTFRLAGNTFVPKRLPTRVVGPAQLQKTQRPFSDWPFGHCAGVRAS